MKEELIENNLEYDKDGLIISLHTFCEQHGPQILICTHLAKTPQPDNLTGSGGKGGKMTSSGNTEESSEEEELLLLFENNNKNERNNSKKRAISDKMQVFFPSNSKIETPPLSSCQDCATCKSVEIGKGFVTADPTEPKYIITSRYPDPIIYSKIKRAGLKSLSCEICPNKEGVIIFGDENEGYVLSYVFKISDINSRGGLRFFSLVSSIQNKITLINFYHLFVRNFIKIAGDIQEKAHLTYEKEKIVLNSTKNESKTFNRNLKRTQHLKPLVQLINQNDIFFKLHISFSNLIYLTKRKEFSEDQLLIQKRFVAYKKLIPKKKNVTKSKFFKSFHELFQLFNDKRTNFLFHILKGSQIITRGKNLKLTKTILTFFQYLLPTKLNTMYFCESYNEEISTVNLLALPEKASIPTENVFVIDVTENNDKVSFICWFNNMISEGTKLPYLLTGIERMLESKLPLEKELIQLESLIEDWLNKVKVFYNLRGKIKNEKDKIFVDFLEMFELAESDKHVLIHWTSGMSEYKKEF